MRVTKKILLYILALGVLFVCAGCQKQEQVNYQAMIDNFVADSTNSFDLTVGEEHIPEVATWLETEGNCSVYVNNTDVVAVTESGKVTALGEGHAYVIFTCKNPADGYQVLCYDVYEPIKTADISNLPDLFTGINLKQAVNEFISTPSNTIELDVGKIHTPDLSSLEDFGNCYSTDELVVTVSESGEVTAVGEGSAFVVIASAVDENFVMYQYIVK